MRLPSHTGGIHAAYVFAKRRVWYMKEIQRRRNNGYVVFQ
jgi:hypothetical protein